jgi:hypothetical protein
MNTRKRIELSLAVICFLLAAGANYTKCANEYKK